MITMREELQLFYEEFMWLVNEIRSYYDYYITPILTSTAFYYFCIVAAVFAICCAYTLLLSTLRDGKPTKEGEPPVPPYWLPVMRHALKLGFGMGTYFEWLQSRRKGNKPSTLLLPGGAKIYVVFDAHSVSTIHRKQKNFSFDPLGIHFAGALGLPPHLQSVIQIGSDAYPPPPHMSVTEIEEKAILPKIHKIYVEYMQGPYLNTMTKQYVKDLDRTLTEDVMIKRILSREDQTAWQRMDVHRWIKHIVFQAGTAALYGHKLTEVAHKTFESDLFEFDADFGNFTKGLPRWWMPSAYATRDRMLGSFAKWNDIALARVREMEKSGEGLTEWDAVAGSRVIQERLRLVNNLLVGDTDRRGAATNHMGLFWATQANSIPSIYWILIQVNFSPTLLTEVLAVLEAHRLPRGPPGTYPTFDLVKLIQDPLIQAVHQETLRYYTASTSARQVLEDTEVDGYLYKKGNMVLLPGYVLQSDKTFWGPNADKFDHTRFHPTKESSSSSSSAEATKLGKEQQAHWKPFGGGTTMCPGRHFATQEIWATVGVLLTAFEWKTQWMGIPDKDMSNYGLGVAKPKWGLNLGMRRREGW